MMRQDANTFQPTQNSSNALYKRNGSPYWYFDLYKQGKRIRKSTKETDWDKAFEKYCLYNNYYGQTSSPLMTVSQLIKMYENPASNPRMESAKLSGSSYGQGHALHVAILAKQLREAFEQYLPAMLDKKICDVQKVDANMIRDCIVKYKKKVCCSAYKMFEALKTMFSKACEDGLLTTNPFSNVRNIIYTQQPRYAYSTSDIKRIIALKDKFRDIEYWCWITFLAATGMRRGELLALQKEQLYCGTLTIDRAIKYDGSTNGQIGLPKCGIIRVIPLPNLALYALSLIYDGKSKRIFDHSYQWPPLVISDAKAIAHAEYPTRAEIWETFNNHGLRHSLNSNLLINHANAVLIGTYLGWNHQQNLPAIQQNYTHVYTRNLVEIADMIDRLYTPACLKPEIEAFKEKRKEKGKWYSYMPDDDSDSFE